MAIYVFSDVHGHVRPLDRLLDRIGPASEDKVYMLGDMIDRGPASVETLRLIHGLPNVTALLGNHEDLLLSCLDNPADEVAWFMWNNNGGERTQEELARLDAGERLELLEWVGSLGRFAAEDGLERPYMMVHAGIAAPSRQELSRFKDQVVQEGLADGFQWNRPVMERFLGLQDPEDLCWIRDRFWSAPTGLMDVSGDGPAVIAGHTPSYFAAAIDGSFQGEPLDGNQRPRILQMGACDETGGEPDRIAIDTGACAGAPTGRVAILRLDDGQAFYEDIQEGE